MTWTDVDWKVFSLTEIFVEIQRGKRLKKDDHIDGVIPYASSTSLNNGIDGFIGNTNGGVRSFANCLTIANSGSVGSTFFQPFRVIASDHVTKLENKQFNKYTYLFLATMISRVSEKYGFNREINDQRIKKEKILLPVNSKGNPDYAFMERYMKQKEIKLLASYEHFISSREWSGNVESKIKWKEFKLTEIFDFVKGDQNNMASIMSGSIPLVSAKKSDNGYKSFVSKSKKLYKENSLTLNNDGDGGAGISYYQPTAYLLDSHVTALYPKTELSKFTLLYISRSITAQRAKFGHGYSINNQRLKVFKLMLPAKENGEPDYLYMESYMKGLECEKLREYLDYKKVN